MERRKIRREEKERWNDDGRREEGGKVRLMEGK